MKLTFLSLFFSPKVLLFIRLLNSNSCVWQECDIFRILQSNLKQSGGETESEMGDEGMLPPDILRQSLGIISLAIFY